MWPHSSISSLPCLPSIVIACLRIHLSAVPSSGKFLEGFPTFLVPSVSLPQGFLGAVFGCRLLPWVCFTYFYVPQNSSDFSMLGTVLDGSPCVTSLILAAARWPHFIHEETGREH